MEQHGVCYRSTTAVFKTGKLITGVDLEEEVGYKNINEVPGVQELRRLGYNDVIAFLKQILDRPSLVAQVVDTKQPSKTAQDKEGVLIAAYGWKVVEILGKGKDGVTFWGHRYNDDKKVMHCVKILSSYAKNFSNHTNIFNYMLRHYHKKEIAIPSILQDTVVKVDYTNYRMKAPYVHIDFSNKHERRRALMEVCKMNAWTIDYTGFVFWDLGYGNGRNFMYNKHKGFQWVDYGGAGMLRTLNFEDLHRKTKGAPVCSLEPGDVNGKDNLIIADSNFIMLQFVLNLEYWHDPENSTADLYSSILQVRRPVIAEIKELMPTFLTNPLAKRIFKEYGEKHDWRLATTWESLREFINANT